MAVQEIPVLLPVDVLDQFGVHDLLVELDDADEGTRIS